MTNLRKNGDMPAARPSRSPLWVLASAIDRGLDPKGRNLSQKPTNGPMTGADPTIAGTELAQRGARKVWHHTCLNDGVRRPAIL
jgi:hypothetical protein